MFFYVLIGFELQKYICVLCFIIYYIVFVNSPLIFKVFKFLSVPWFFICNVDLQYAKPYNLKPELSLYAGEKRWKFNMEP